MSETWQDDNCDIRGCTGEHRHVDIGLGTLMVSHTIRDNALYDALITAENET